MQEACVYVFSRVNNREKLIHLVDRFLVYNSDVRHLTGIDVDIYIPKLEKEDMKIDVFF